MRKLTPVTTIVLTFAFAVLSRPAGAQTIVSTFAGNAQHTAVYIPAAQDLNSIHWKTSIDLNNSGAFAHYGGPLLTPANTIFVPVKTATNGFQINVFNAANGAALYALTTDYIMPPHNWILPYQPALATGSFGTRLYYPGAGGTIYYIDNPDSTSHGAPVQQVFYTTLANYQANASGFNSTVFINTPITTDSTGDVFFGFRVQGTAPAPLSTTQSGFARIDPNGNATFVLAGTAANDTNIGRDTHNSGPALSNDQATLYVAVKSASTATYGYLLGLDSTTLATKFKVFLKDPRSNNANNANLMDDSTATPMVGPDNDVYFGIFGNPANGSRGFMLHFSSDLTVEKAPGGFGWDNTPAIVPASMVLSYTGTSSYLLFSKYNNYANVPNDSADGVNRIALLDPNATQVDVHPSSNGMLVMREVLTIIGPTADQENRSASLPLAVREWCINTPAVNPATTSVFTPSEDGRVYRWNLVSNSLTQFLQIGAGIGEPYVPTVIGPDGTVFTLNGGSLFALGSLTGVGINVTSSTPDVRSVVAGQSLTFTAAVTNTGAPGNAPTGTVTFQDTVYFVPSPGNLTSTTTVLASNVPLDGTGHASVTTSELTADTHFVTAIYSGDANFSTGNAALIQTVHGYASNTALASSHNPSSVAQAVTFTATVVATPPGIGTPTGMLAFQEGNNILTQVPLNGSGVASFNTSALTLGSHTVSAVYASDTAFAASSGNTVQVVQSVITTTTTVSSSPNPSTLGQSVTFMASVTSGSGVPAGAVTFTEGSTVLAANVAVDGNGHAAFSTAALAEGSHIITATFTGASGWANSSGSDNVSPQVVNKSATTTALGASPNPSFVGQTVTLTATAVGLFGGSPTGTVTFKKGTTTLGTGTLTNGSASFSTSSLALGSATFAAVYSGDNNFLGNTSNSVTQSVKKITTTTKVSSTLNPSFVGQSVTFTATITSGFGLPPPDGETVTFKRGTTTLGTAPLSGGSASISTSSLAAGSYTITASYAGDAKYVASSGSLLQKVNKYATTTAVSAAPNPSTYGQSVTLTATVSSSQGAPPDGEIVTFKNGATVLGTGTLSGGTAMFSTAALGVGSKTITAVYAGDATLATSSGTVTQKVNKAGTTTTLTSDPNPSTVGTTVTFTATVTSSGGTPTGTVAFKQGATTLGTGTLNPSGTATFSTSTLTKGSHSVAATYNGSTNFATSTSASVTQVAQ